MLYPCLEAIVCKEVCLQHILGTSGYSLLYSFSLHNSGYVCMLKNIKHFSITPYTYFQNVCRPFKSAFVGHSLQIIFCFVFTFVFFVVVVFVVVVVVVFFFLGGGFGGGGCPFCGDGVVFFFFFFFGFFFFVFWIKITFTNQRTYAKY